MVDETAETRRQAERLLRSLMDHKARSAKRAGDVGAGSAARCAKEPGESLDVAIASTQRMIATLSSVIEEARRELSPEDLKVLESS